MNFVSNHHSTFDWAVPLLVRFIIGTATGEDATLLSGDDNFYLYKDKVNVEW